MATKHRSGNASDYTMRICVVPGTQVFRRSDNRVQSNFFEWDDTTRVTNYRSIEGTVNTMSRAEAIAGIVELTQDAVHQTGTTPSFAPSHILKALEAG